MLTIPCLTFVVFWIAAFGRACGLSAGFVLYLIVAAEVEVDAFELRFGPC